MSSARLSCHDGRASSGGFNQEFVSGVFVIVPELGDCLLAADEVAGGVDGTRNLPTIQGTICEV